MMIEILAKWLLKNALGRVVTGVLVATLLSGALWAGCQVKSCLRAKEELREYHRADEIRKEDPKVDKFIKEQKERVDKMVTPDDFDRELERLRDYGAH